MSPEPHAGDSKLKHHSGKMNAERLRFPQKQSKYFPLTDSLIVPKSRVARALDTCVRYLQTTHRVVSSSAKNFVVGNLKNPGKQLKQKRSRSFESESSIPSRDVTHPASDLPPVPNLKDLPEKVRKRVESSSELITKKDLNSTSPKESSKFSRKMTGGSVEKASTMDRKSWQTQSSSAGSGDKPRSVRSASVTATDKDLVEGDTAAPIEGTLEKLKISDGLKREGKPAAISTAQPKVVKCLRSPGDYVFLDLENTGEKSSENSDSSPGLSPKAKGSEAESGADDQDPRSILEKRLDAIRYIVKTIFQVQGQSDEDTKGQSNEDTKGQSNENTKSGKAPQDAKKWDTKNMKCSKCYGDCPICGKACCIFDIARRTAAEADPEHTEAANQILKLMQSLGCSVLEASTYSLCTTPGGCGRYVCSDCWGICPVELCRDVQCKDCKDDPWAACDWHDY